jgi:hypothetical protein
MFTSETLVNKEKMSTRLTLNLRNLGFRRLSYADKNAANDVILGGAGPYYTNMTTVEFFDLATGKWINLPNLERGR